MRELLDRGTEEAANSISRQGSADQARQGQVPPAAEGPDGTRLEDLVDEDMDNILTLFCDFKRRDSWASGQVHNHSR